MGLDQVMHTLDKLEGRIGEFRGFATALSADVEALGGALPERLDWMRRWTVEFRMAATFVQYVSGKWWDRFRQGGGLRDEEVREMHRDFSRARSRAERCYKELRTAADNGCLSAAWPDQPELVSHPISEVFLPPYLMVRLLRMLERDSGDVLT